ncbi:hypothetical protein JTE90_028776 [Oedothorax gibbosus]|uniref:G-protein coupled receptors family 1 profile domain-containing protein n=1 Tax=Oedothorax gibbosus TaxID=931172 RepID=A0AAV6VZH2_9ARAC|nr:hypothetical protein JTE90_028776 [Oedothorax gibbosus]
MALAVWDGPRSETTSRNLSPSLHESLCSPSSFRKMQGFADRNATSPNTSQSSRTLFQFISLGLIIAVGSAGNSIVIYAFGKFLRVRRRTPHTFVVGFVSLDMLRVLVCMPLIFVSAVHPLKLKYGPEVCQMIAFTNVLCMVGNSLNVCGMAFDRYFDNKYHAAYRRRCRSSFGTAILLIVLSLSFTFSIPAVYSGPARQSIVQPQCTFPNYYYVEELETLLVPMGVTITFIITNVIYAKLFLLLRSRRKMRPVIYEPAVSDNWGFYDPRVPTVRNRWLADSLSDTPIAVVSRPMYQSHPIPTNYDIAVFRSNKQKDSEKITKLCFTVHVIFSVMWLPYVVSLYYVAFDSKNEGKGLPEWIEITVTWVTFLQATITPSAFASFSGLTRRKFRVLNGTRFSPTLSSSST